MTTPQKRARLVDAILQVGERKDTVDENETTAVNSDRDSERSPEDTWKVIDYCEYSLCDFGFRDGPYFVPVNLFISDRDVAVKLRLIPSKLKIWYLKRLGTVPPENIHFLRSRMVQELFQWFGPVIDEDVDDDGGEEEEDPPVINDSSPLWFDDLIDAIRNMEFKDLSYRKLLLGLQIVHPDLKRILYDTRNAIEWRDLKAIFGGFGHKLRFGHCKLGLMYNVQVIMVKEGGDSSRYLVHKVKDIDLSNPMKIRCQIQPEYQRYQRLPYRFRDVPVYDRRQF